MRRCCMHYYEDLLEWELSRLDNLINAFSVALYLQGYWSV